MKKFIVFIFMLLYYITSPAVPQENEILDISEKVKQTFISELEAHNPSKYYITNGRNTSVHIFFEKHEEDECAVNQIKNFFSDKNFTEDYELYPQHDIIPFLYEIATDINRSLRN